MVKDEAVAFTSSGEMLDFLREVEIEGETYKVAKIKSQYLY